jgi:hypothetical protein
MNVPDRIALPVLAVCFVLAVFIAYVRVCPC